MCNDELTESPTFLAVITVFSLILEYKLEGSISLTPKLLKIFYYIYIKYTPKNTNSYSLT